MKFEDIETVEQAVDYILNNSSVEYKDYIKSLKPIHLELSVLHFGLGLEIRNTFMLTGSEKFKKAYSEYQIYGLSCGEQGEGKLIDAIWRNLNGFSTDEKINELNEELEKISQDYKYDFEKLNVNNEYLELLSQKTSALLGLTQDNALKYVKLKIEAEKNLKNIRNIDLKDTREFQQKREVIGTQTQYILALLTDEQIDYANSLKTQISNLKEKLEIDKNNDALQTELNNLQSKKKELLLTKSIYF